MSRVANLAVVLGGGAALALGAAGVVGWHLAHEPAPEVAAPTAKKPKAKGSIGDVAASRQDGLSMPAAKRCLPPPTGEGLSDDGMVGSSGLSYEDVSSSMKAFLPKTLRCSPPGGVAGTVTADLTVGCDGRVSSVKVADAGGLPDEFVSCVVDTLKFAPFPAHDLPDGYEFEFPLTFSR